MIYGSVCSGIEAASVAWQPLGWKSAFFSEIEKFPRAVLTHHYPNTPLHGDFTTIGDEYGSIELLVGGTPCQSFSVAGLRKGMDDDRGNLALEYLRLAQRLRPRWLVWENVPGVLSSNKGNDFFSFGKGLQELGYGFAYRVLDAQHFGVPQRRRRVFVVGCLGDWRSAAAVLFERYSLQGHIAPRRKAQQDIAGTITSGSGRRRGSGISPSELAFTASSFGQYQNGVGTLRAHGGDYGGGSETLIKAHRMVSFGEYTSGESASTLAARDYKSATDLVVHGTQDPCVSDNLSFALGCNNGQENVVAHTCATKQQAMTCELEMASTLGANDYKEPQVVATGTHSLVRRLTPVECERLQGFPDNYTQIAWRNKEALDCPDGPRYKAIGNSMAVPVMRWIGERIEQVSKMEIKEAVA
jgi:DNA (cytosine-5)-methyltransferase 1